MTFDEWYGKQKYSLGNIPSYNMIEEMRRAWCAASKAEFPQLEAKLLKSEAANAEMREALEKADKILTDVLWGRNKGEEELLVTGIIGTVNQALSSSAGKDLLEKMGKARKNLKQ